MGIQILNFVFARFVDLEDASSIGREVGDVDFFAMPDGEIGQESASACKIAVKLSEYTARLVWIDLVDSALYRGHIKHAFAVKSETGYGAIATDASVLRKCALTVDKPDRAFAAIVNATRSGGHA